MMNDPLMPLVDLTDSTERADDAAVGGCPELGSWRERAAAWSRDNRWSLLALGGAIVVFLVVTALAIAERVPLEHDEAVYSNRGRFFEGELDNGRGFWAGYRAPGVPFLLGLVYRVTGPSDVFGRLLIVGFGILAIVAVFVLGTALLDSRAGAAAAGLLVLSSGFTRHAARIFVDVPGMALPMTAITVTYLLWRNGPLHRAAYLVVPLLAMAGTYVRFGAPATLASGLVAIVVVLAPQQWRTRRREFVTELLALAATVGLATGLVLLVPWFTSQPVSPLRAQQAFRDAKGVPMLDSVADLVAITWPDGERHDFFHPLVFWVIVALVSIAVVASLRIAVIRRAVVFGSIGGVATVVALNVNLSLIAPQYLVLSAPFLVIVAGAGFVVVADAAGRVGRPAQAALALVLVAGGLYASVGLHRDVQDETARLTRAFTPLRDTGFLVRSFGNDDCVVLTGTAPQIGWYSGCRMSTWGPVELDRPLEEIRYRTDWHDPPKTVYVVDVLEGKREPNSEVFDANTEHLTLVGEVGTPDDGPRRYLRIFEVDECVLVGSCPTG